ncbi:MAG: hypothetical protein KME21_07435 [Desmonostoc vinosum HA7617-LM4]|jgi:hypothetical protein|nr:hypothetical protein [Desmonostoc vinosum HA7617-LM4]
MLLLKNKQLIWLILFLLGIAYFSAMSQIEINYFLKSFIAIMPMQLGAIIYITYRRWSRR